MATRGQDLFKTNSSYPGNQSVTESPTPELEITVEVAQTYTQGLVSHYPFPLKLQTINKSKHVPNCYAERAVVHRWDDCREGGWNRNPTTRRCGDWATIDNSCLPEGPPSFRCSRLSFSVRGRACTWKCGTIRGDRALQAQRGSFDGPSTVQPWDTSLHRIKGCDNSPGHGGLRVIE